MCLFHCLYLFGNKICLKYSQVDNYVSFILKVFCYFIRIIIFKLTSHTIGSTVGCNIYVYKIFDSIYLRKSSPTCALKKSRINRAFWASGSLIYPSLPKCMVQWSCQHYWNECSVLAQWFRVSVMCQLDGTLYFA